MQKKALFVEKKENYDFSTTESRKARARAARGALESLKKKFGGGKYNNQNQSQASCKNIWLEKNKKKRFCM